MDYKVEKLGKNKVKLEVTVEAAAYNEAIKKSYEKNKEYFQVQGFRKGKAPFGMVKRMYGVEALYEDADNFVLNDTYFKIVEDEKIKPVDFPHVDIISRGENEEFKYTAEVETVPEFDLPDYKGMEVEKHEHEFDENEVDAQLEEMREQNARIKTLEDSKIENGNIAVFDFVGTIDGVEFPGGSADNFELEIGSGSFIGNFEEQMVGMSVGEEKDVVVTFPENYGVEDLNGKEATFKVKINEIKAKELPELDDDFASEVSEFETMKELKADLVKKAKADYEKHMDSAAKEGALNKLVEITEIEMPDAVVERQTDRMIEELAQKLAMQGMDIKQYFEMTGADENQTREMMKPNALLRAKTDLVIEKLMETLNAQASDDEIKDLADEYTKDYNRDEKFTEMLLNNNKDGLAHDVKLRKVLKELVDNAKFVAHKHEEVATEETEEPKKEKKTRKKKTEEKEEE